MFSSRPRWRVLIWLFCSVMVLNMVQQKKDSLSSLALSDHIWMRTNTWSKFKYFHWCLESKQITKLHSARQNLTCSWVIWPSFDTLRKISMEMLYYFLAIPHHILQQVHGSLIQPVKMSVMQDIMNHWSAGGFVSQICSNILSSN